jgi:hypothetical protein
MSDNRTRRLDQVNPIEPWMLNTRYVPGQQKGHYESFYQRANHPTRPLAFWIRYTIFSPKGRPQDAIGELWAVFFDGESGRHIVAKEEHPIERAEFARDHFSARVADSTLGPGRLRGHAAGPVDTIGWDLNYDGAGEPMFLLNRKAFDRPFPSAKSLVALPHARYRGSLEVAGRHVEVEDWVGSQNHNWGSRHTDHYAFGQVAGFDDAPDSFLEVVTAQVRLGPVRTPKITALSLRHRGETHELLNPLRGARAEAEFGYFYWRFATGNDRLRVEGRIEAEPKDFVALNYYNPPGGIKHCLNTKIGRCTLWVHDQKHDTHDVLTTDHRALFEILTDHRGHGIGIRA